MFIHGYTCMCNFKSVWEHVVCSMSWCMTECIQVPVCAHRAEAGGTLSVCVPKGM